MLQFDTTKALWVRLVAVWCVLWSFGLGVAQAAHSHDRPVTSKRIVVSAAVEDGSGLAEVCPLCAALHFFAAETSHRAELHLSSEVLEQMATPLGRVVQDLPFALSSRPPPTTERPLPIVSA